MSDNMCSYTSAAEELSTLLQFEDLTTALGTHGVVWKLIPKKATWFGGFLGIHNRVILTFRRFASHKSLPQIMISDNTFHTHQLLKNFQPCYNLKI